MVDELKDMNLGDLLLWLLRRRRRFRVSGNSMLPLLKPGDEVLVDPQAYRSVQPHCGDIVVARHPYRPNLRLIKRIASVIDDRHYVLKGDNPAESTDSDAFGPVSANQIVGRVTSRF